MKLPITFDRLVNFILLGVVLFLSLCSSPTVTINEGISEEEYNYRLEVFKIGLENQKLKDEIQGFKQEIIKDSVFIHNASTKQIDSLFTDYFK